MNFCSPNIFQMIVIMDFDMQGLWNLLYAMQRSRWHLLKKRRYLRFTPIEIICYIIVRTSEGLRIVQYNFVLIVSVIYIFGIETFQLLKTFPNAGKYLKSMFH